LRQSRGKSGFATQKIIKLLDEKAWKTVYQNLCIFEKIDSMIVDIMPELSQEELDEIKNSKLIQIHTSIET
jgi:hypothetical protein